MADLMEALADITRELGASGVAIQSIQHVDDGDEWRGVYRVTLDVRGESITYDATGDEVCAVPRAILGVFKEGYELGFERAASCTQQNVTAIAESIIRAVRNG